MKLASDILKDFLDNSRFFEKIKHSQVVDIYNHHVVENFHQLKNTQAYDYQNNTLLIIVKDSEKSFEMMLIKSQIVKAVNDYILANKMEITLVKNIKIQLISPSKGE